jgi:Tfp pilus assembly protein PilO
MPKDSKKTWRIILGILVAANLAAAAFVIFPPGGSAEDLEQELAHLQAQASTGRARLAETKTHVAAVEKGRTEGDKFLSDYFLERRTAYSTLLAELVAAADAAKVKPKEHAYSTEPIEGSDTLSMMTITANYEGSYQNLMNFIHQIDQSSRLLIIEALNAAPQQGAGTLSISMKIDTFVREDASIGDKAAKVSTDGAPVARKNQGSEQSR